MAHSEVNDVKACSCIGTQKPWCGSLGKDDYDVRLGDASGPVVGSIMRQPQAPEELPWFWTITAREQLPSVSRLRSDPRTGDGGF
jgi:hypothetical protein